MQQGVILVCLILIIAAAIACATFRSLLKSAISLAVISALLAIVLFAFGATWAAVFELSVCAGLVTVVFISAISMTRADRHEPKQEQDHRKAFAPLPFVLIFIGVAFIAALLVSGFNIEAVTQTSVAVSFKEAFWNTRQADILGQIIVILAGAFAVAILFKESDKA